jgi:serine/threonine protein phosphatase PrpC
MTQCLASAVERMGEVLATKEYNECGTTFAGAWIRGREIAVATVGDSPVFIASRKKAEANFKVTRCTPEDNVEHIDEIERERIKKAGGSFSKNNKRLVSGDKGLQLTRALGDFEFRECGL